MVRVVGATRDFVEKFALGKFDFMSVQVVFCFEVAKNDTIVERVGLAVGVDLVKRLIQYFQLILFHFHDTPHENLSILVGQTGNRLVKVFSERGVDV
jgi:hypothetical protein